MSEGQQPDRDEDRILAGEYALGLLTPEEEAAFEARLAQDPDLRALYATWAEDFATLTDDMPEVAPPSRVRERIMDQLFVHSPRRSLAERLGLGWFTGSLAVAAVAAVIALNAGLFDLGPHAPGDPAYVARIAAEDETLVVAAALDAEKGVIYLDRRAGEARPGRALEVWLIAGERAPVSLGVLPEARRVGLAVPEGLRAQFEGATLAISDEPAGGSPTGAPTGDVLATGAVISG